MCQFRFDIWNLQNCKNHPKCCSSAADLPRSIAQLSAPAEMSALIYVVTCVMIVIGKSVAEICLGKTELSQGLVGAAITFAPAVITYATVHLMCSRPNQ